MRDLTAEERAVLAHIVVDPDGWWAHANEAENVPDAEAALIAKVDRWRSAYEQSLSEEGENYKTRAERDVS